MNPPTAAKNCQSGPVGPTGFSSSVRAYPEAITSPMLLVARRIVDIDGAPNNLGTDGSARTSPIPNIASR